MNRSFLSSVTVFARERPKIVLILLILATVLFGLQFPRMTIDTVSVGLCWKGCSRSIGLCFLHQ